MAYGDNKTEFEGGAPKKADVLIRSTQHIAIKQEELNEQANKAIARLDEAIELFSKNNQDSSYIVKQSGEIFSQLQSENSALKQELLYLAKQSENIYAGLAEKITELSDRAKTREEAMDGLADKINDVAQQTRKSEDVYSDIADKLAELSEQNRRNEKLYESLTEKLDALYEHSKKNERAYGELSDRIGGEKAEPSDLNSEILNKINFISEQLRRSEGAHSMLADKFEILSMRVEQFGFESAKPAPNAYVHPQVQTVAYPAPVQTLVRDEIDYDRLAEKVAALISAREVVSPDYIASKVAEQIVLPEIDAANVRVSVDYDRIAKQVSDAINENGVKVNGGQVEPATVNATLNIDEDGLAERLAEKLGGLGVQETAAASAQAIDEDALAERLAEKLGGAKVRQVSPVAVPTDIDEEELADSIALKVGSLKSEDFDIIVDDEGCTSISKGIADNLNYEIISNIIADKLRDALDLAAVNAPDYEEMAERISEKITVAGINEDAIADKAAAVLSNYLPELDADEIADKVTGAVIDVVSAIPQPTVDAEAITNGISEKLIESQEDHDYDIVIDDDGITKICELVTARITDGTNERFDKVEEQISRLTEVIETAAEEKEEIAEAEEQTAENAENAEETEETQEAKEQDYSYLSGLMAEEIAKGTASRFDKVEEDIAKLAELVSGAVGDGEGEFEEYVEEDYSGLSEAVAAEIEKGIEKNVSARLDGMEEGIARITELLTVPEDEAETDESEEGYEEEEAETADDLTVISEAVAEEIRKNVSSRLDGMEESIARITELLTVPEDEETEADAAEESYEEEEVETDDDLTVLSEVVAAEIEKGIEKNVSSRLDGMEENIAKLTEMVSGNAENSIAVAAAIPAATDYDRISEVVAAEIEKGVTPKFDGVNENIAKITEIVAGGVATEIVTEKYEEDFSGLSEVVAAEIEKSVSPRLDEMREDISRMTGIVASGAVNEMVSENGKADYSDLSGVVAVEVERGMKERFDKVENEISRITELVKNDARSVNDDRIDRLHDEIIKLSAMVEAGRTAGGDDRIDRLQGEIARLAAVVKSGSVKDNRFDKVEDDVAEIKALIAGGAVQTKAVEEAAPAVAANAAEEEIPLVTVSDLVPGETKAEEAAEEFEEEAEEADDGDDDDDDFLIDVLDMDKFSDNELMPGELSDFAGGVDFANMMKFKRSFIARIIQSSDEYKQYYGEVKHALLSYKKVNSNVAWGAERFNKGRETIARMKIRGKTLCLYLALDPNEYKTSVYHHLDVSDNKSVSGTPMMVKIKSNLGVRKALRLIDEMLALRNGEKKEIPERDYAAMYPYETIEELIEDGLVKDVRKK